MRRRAVRGSTLVDLLVGTTLGLGVLGALSATVGAGAGLAPADLARVRAVSLELALRLPGLAGEAARRVRVALRRIP